MFASKARISLNQVQPREYFKNPLGRRSVEKRNLNFRRKLMNLNAYEINQLASAVAEKLWRAGMLDGRSNNQFSPGAPKGDSNFDITSALSATLASAVAGKLAAGKKERGRMVSDGMLRLASAVSYKLAKAEQPETISFNKVASEVAKLLYDAKKKPNDNRAELEIVESKQPDK